MPQKKSPAQELPKYSEGIAAALLSAREAVMAPIRPILRQHDITEQQWRLLRVLIDLGPMEISRAADAAMIMAPSVTRMLKDLTERGLIKRRPDKNDARRSILSITPAGRRVVKNTAAHTSRLLQEYRGAFGTRRFNALIRELRDFQAAINQRD